MEPITETIIEPIVESTMDIQSISSVCTTELECLQLIQSQSAEQSIILNKIDYTVQYVTNMIFLALLVMIVWKVLKLINKWFLKGIID